MKKREKPKRDDSIRFKATEAEKASYEQAGIITDQSMSNWIRKTLNAEVEKLAKERG